MSEHRPLVLTLTVFATAMAALGVAALTGWQRCGRGSDCSSELALGVVAVAPACLIGILLLFIVRTRLRIPWMRTVLLAAGIGVAALPLAAFLLQDVWLIPIFSLLVAAAVLLALVGERAAADDMSLADRQPPAQTPEGPPDVAVDVERGPGASTALTARVLVLLDEMATLNQEIVRLGERLARQG